MFDVENLPELTGNYRTDIAMLREYIIYLTEELMYFLNKRSES